jgi:hypothetical protein
MELEVGHEMPGHVLNAGASAEIDAHQRADYLAVLIANKGASTTQCPVYAVAKKAVKCLHDLKNTAKWGY